MLNKFKSWSIKKIIKQNLGYSFRFQIKVEFKFYTLSL